MLLYVDAGWILQIQASVVEDMNVPLRDWGALEMMAQRHRFERFTGEPYYEEAPTRAATLLETAVLFRPFADYNAVVGAACADQYLRLSGTPIAPPQGAMPQLVRDIRNLTLDLAGVARRLRDWA